MPGEPSEPLVGPAVSAAAEAAARRRAELEVRRGEAEARRAAYLAVVAAGAPADLVAAERRAWDEARARVARLEPVVLSYEGVAVFRQHLAAGMSLRALTAGPARRRKRSHPGGAGAAGDARAEGGANSGAARP